MFFFIRYFTKILRYNNQCFINYYLKVHFIVNLLDGTTWDQSRNPTTFNGTTSTGTGNIRLVWKMSLSKLPNILQSKKEAKIKNRNSQAPPRWERDNVTIRHHKLEPRGQPFPSRWPQGINKQTCMKAQQNKAEIT